MNTITYEDRVPIYKLAFDTYGRPTQKVMALEEMSELAKEICKDIRGQTSIDHIADEIADVTIMLEQLRLIYNCNELVCERMDMKIERLRRRMKRGVDNG